MSNKPCKPNVRSFRYSDEVAAVLERHPGNNLNDKFENLVIYCSYRVPKVAEELEEKKRELQDLNNKILQAKVQLSDCQELISQKLQLSEALSFLTLKSIDFKRNVDKVFG